MIAYLDASIVVPLIKIEDASGELRDYLQELRDDGHLLVSARLVETEVRRAAVRQGISQATVTTLLDTINVFELTPADYVTAGRFAFENLGSLDALHLAAALRVPADVMLSDDARLVEASEASGLPVLDTAIPARAL
ncbi:MAG: PIN domain-containing protein [Candidatus Nanopelagicales bacterium]|nr:PIN domain-containing protein [Candidatus Nanopelagicales bacterium]MCF8538231.1 PIN domain-containing protein [Candidatus Nanopelagicales bacterium]MCF8557433.1 PIN domain-containing protein [Candidatus Nanopelagicales bacterium]